MKVLIVEDDKTVAHALQHLLESHHYAVDVAEDGEAGLQMADASTYDLILLDVVVPKLNGVSLCQQLRAQGLEVPILLLTGQEAGRKALANIGADDCVIKPFDAEALITRVQALLRRGRLKHQVSITWGELNINSLEPLNPENSSILGSKAEQSEAPKTALETLQAQNERLKQTIESERDRYRALQHRDRQWQALFDQALDAITILDDEARYVDVNPAACRLFGVGRAAFLECSAADFSGSDVDFAQVWQVFLQQGHMSGEFWVYRPDGTIRETEFSAIANFVPGRHMSILRDISDRKQLEAERKQAESQRQQQWERDRLIAEITHSIRQTLDLDQILQSAVDQVRQLLQNDRVIIFRLQPNQQGIVEAESVAPEWTAMVSMVIRDSCFSDRYTELYRQGRVTAIRDIYAANYNPCHINLLSSFQVRANLIVPILQEQKLWGLLIAHHCSKTRSWSAEHIQLLKQVGAQLGIAIQQAELYQQVSRELLERRQIQSALQKSEERFRSLTAFAPVGIYQTDTEGHCVYTNARWQEISGLTFEESLGDGWERGIHPEDRAAVFTAWSRFVHERRPFSLEFRFLTPQGNERWVHGQATAIYSTAEEIVGYVGVNEDITERKRAEQRIREQATLIDIATDAIFVRDLEDRIVFWSQGAERLYGWTSDQAMGQAAHQLFGRDAHSTIEDILKIVIAQGFWQGELAQATKANQNITVESRWTLMRDAAGRPQSLLVVNTDITEKKQLESQFHQLQRLESLGRLASGIAHDLNNVLTPILAIAQLLRLTQQELDDQAREHLEIIERSAKRGADMVKQVLTFARGGYEEPTTVDLLPLLRDVVNIIQKSFPSSIRVRSDFSVLDAPNALTRTVLGNQTQLHRVFLNLCTNARDAMLSGGVLTLSAERVIVDPAFARGNLGLEVGTYVAVTIADTGVGIPPDVRDRMFEPFFTTKEIGKGTGLGLAMVLGIVKNYGGFLQVFSEVGQGTQMKVYLPTTEQMPTEDERQDKLRGGNGQCILVVDDDSAVQQSTRSLLENQGYITLAANDGREALERYGQHQGEIQLVILDVMMPTMGGVPLIKRLRAIDPGVKVIAISGLASNRDDVLAAGADIFLAKPYTLDNFLKHIGLLLEGRPDA